MTDTARMERLTQADQTLTRWQTAIREEIARLTKPPYSFASRVVIDGIPEEEALEVLNLINAYLIGKPFDIYADESELVICSTCQDRVLDWQFEHHTCPKEAN